MNVWLNFLTRNIPGICLRNYQEGTYSTMTLDEIIGSDKIFVRNNLKLFDPEFIKRHPHCF